jgi:hypothetical protein
LKSEFFEGKETLDWNLFGIWITELRVKYTMDVVKGTTLFSVPEEVLARLCKTGAHLKILVQALVVATFRAN